MYYGRYYYPLRGAAQNDVFSCRLTHYEQEEFIVIWLKISVNSQVMPFFIYLLYWSPYLIADISIEILKELSNAIENISVISLASKIAFMWCIGTLQYLVAYIFITFRSR